ncbi:hypothetical protein JD844_009543, partial [Phrynosoma platyrhinos]
GHGGSTLLPPHVTNEFPEYGTMEEGTNTLDVSPECQGETIICASDGLSSEPLFCGTHVNGSPGDDIKSSREGLQTPLREKELAPKVFKLHEMPNNLECDNAHDGDRNAFGSEMQMEKERRTGSMVEEAAKEKVLAGQEKPTEMPLPSEITAERKLYWITEEDSMVLTVEIQPETSKAVEDRTDEPHKVCEKGRHIPLAGSESKCGGPAGGLGDAWADFEREFSVFGPETEKGASERRISKEAAVSKHVEFQGVEILWIQKAEEQKGAGHSEAGNVEKRTFSVISNCHTPSPDSTELVGLPERPWNVSWENLKPVASMAEGGEDEVFVTEEKKSWAQEMDRLMEEEETVSGRMEDVLGQPHSEVSTDVYSSQFESILDNASLYYSAESLETLYSEPDSYFSFEMPLTPMIQQRIKEDAQFLERTPDGEVRKGHCDGVSNGLTDVKESDITEDCHLGR